MASARISVALLALVTCLDGLDSNVVSFASPYFAAEYGLNASQTGNVFSMHLVGTILGGFLFAYLGDRFGRRPAILLATTVFGALTLAFYFVTGYESLLLLRFLDGIPLGGLLPLVFALGIEYAPTGLRATLVTLIMVGYSLGTAAGGPLANAVAPGFGWKAVFLLGGAAALASAALLAVKLPESAGFLADQASTFRPALLFQGKLARITPLIWIAYIASSFAVFLVINWTPVFFESLGYSRQQAATAAALNSLLGAVAGVGLMRFTDKLGPAAITAMPTAAAVLLLCTSLAGPAFLPLSIASGALLIGGHFGMHSICGLYYPTAYRSNGAGWAISIAKLGAVVGPLVAGWLMAALVPVPSIYAVLAAVPALFAICIFALGRLSPADQTAPNRL